MHGTFEGALPDGWQGGVPVTKYWNGDYIKLYRVTRPCNGCSAEISIDVTKKALQGVTKNSGLLTRNCPTCKAVRKAGGPGSRGGMSRPVVTGAPQASAAAPAAVSGSGLAEELAELKAELKASYEVSLDHMQEKGDAIRALQALRKEIDPLKAELHDLKTRLTKYELQPAMAEYAGMPWLLKPG